MFIWNTEIKSVMLCVTYYPLCRVTRYCHSNVCGCIWLKHMAYEASLQTKSNQI